MYARRGCQIPVIFDNTASLAGLEVHTDIGLSRLGCVSREPGYLELGELLLVDVNSGGRGAMNE